jgi:hypothetical protein
MCNALGSILSTKKKGGGEAKIEIQTSSLSGKIQNIERARPTSSCTQQQHLS